MGYHNVLAKILSQYKTIEINCEAILQMHKDMFKFTDLIGGKWKSKDNKIEEQLPNGQWITQFHPTSAKEMPFYMNELCKRFDLPRIKNCLVIETIKNLPDEFSIGDVVKLCPGISRPMIRHILNTLRDQGEIVSIGAGRSAKWRKK